MDFFKYVVSLIFTSHLYKYSEILDFLNAVRIFSPLNYYMTILPDIPSMLKINLVKIQV